MKNSNERKDEHEDSKLDLSDIATNPYMMSHPAHQASNRIKQKPQNNLNEPIFMTATEPTAVEMRSKQYHQDNLIRKYNQIDTGQPVHLKSFSQQRSDRLLNKKKVRNRSYNLAPPPHELSALDFQENSSILGGIATTTRKKQQKLNYQGLKGTEKMKTNQDFADDHVSNFEWLMQLKTQQLQKNMHIMFMKNERKKLLQSNSRMIHNPTEQNIESFCISPQKSNNIAVYENLCTKSNEFDFIIKQEKYLNQKIQRDVNQKQDYNNVVQSSPVNGNDLNTDEKLFQKINAQAQKLNTIKQQTNRINKHSQGMQSPLSQIKKELQAYNEDFCLPYLQPFRGVNNKTKVYMLNKQKGKKITYRESSLSNNTTATNNVGSKQSHYNSPENTLSPKQNFRKNLDSNINLLIDYQASSFIKEDKLKFHLENGFTTKEDLEGDELYTEHFKSPLSIQLYDPNKLEQERFKLTFRKKSNTAQLGQVFSGESPKRKENITQTSNYQDSDVNGKTSASTTHSQNAPNINNVSKAIRMKLKQSPLSTDLNNIQYSIEKVRQTEVLQNNQIVLPNLNIKSYHTNKIPQNNIENLDIISQPIHIQVEDQVHTMEETSNDFFQLQNYYQKKYYTNDKVPKTFVPNQNKEILSYQNSLSKNTKQIQNAKSLLTEYDYIEEPIKTQTNKRRSSSFFSSPQKQQKSKQVLLIQNSLQLTPFTGGNSSSAQPQQTKKGNNQNYSLANDLQPWEDQQNFNETNFFQIVKERTDKSIRNKRKESQSESSHDDRQSGQSGKSSEYYD